MHWTKSGAKKMSKEDLTNATAFVCSFLVQVIDTVSGLYLAHFIVVWAVLMTAEAEFVTFHQIFPRNPPHTQKKG